MFDGEEVKEFWGSFNLPPHIKRRMRQLDWSPDLAQISHYRDIIRSLVRPLPNSEQVARVSAEADPVRMAELGPSLASLHTLVTISLFLGKIGWEYDPLDVSQHRCLLQSTPRRSQPATQVPTYQAEPLG